MTGLVIFLLLLAALFVGLGAWLFSWLLESVREKRQFERNRRGLLVESVPAFPNDEWVRLTGFKDGASVTLQRKDRVWTQAQ